MKIKHYSFPVLLGIVCISTVFSAAANVMDYSPEYLYPQLRDVLKQAEASAVEIEILGYEKSKAILDKELAMTDNRPSVSFGTGVGFAGDNSGNDIQPTVTDLGLGLRYQLYQWGAKAAGHRKAEYRYGIYELKMKEDLSKYGQKIREAFLKLIIDNFQLKISKLEQDIIQENIAQDSLNFEDGRLSKENYERILNSRKLRIMDLEHGKLETERGLQDFRDLTGVQSFGMESVPTNIPSIEDLTESINTIASQVRAKNYRDIYTVQQASLSLDIAEESITQARSNFRPSFNLSARTSLAPEFSKDNDLVMSYSGGINISQTFYSGGANQRKLQKTYYDRRLEIANIRDAEITARKLLDRMIEDLQYSYNRLQISESEYTMALANYEKSKDEYARGRVSDLQFMYVETNRMNEEKTIYMARMNYLISVSKFLSYIGKDPILNILSITSDKELVTLEE